MCSPRYLCSVSWHRARNIHDFYCIRLDKEPANPARNRDSMPTISPVNVFFPCPLPWLGWNQWNGDDSLPDEGREFTPIRNHRKWLVFSQSCRNHTKISELALSKSPVERYVLSTKPTFFLCRNCKRTQV